jgi:hypothetical protein
VTFGTCAPVLGERTLRAMIHSALVIGVVLALVIPDRVALAQEAPLAPVPTRAAGWEATGGALRVETHLGRESFALDRGFAMLPDIDLRQGTIEFDMAASERSNFMGLLFHGQSKDAFEVVFFRFVASGTPEAVQYQPVLNGGGTWQIFHGPGANATAVLPRGEWIKVKVDIRGGGASVYLNGAPTPVLVVPDLALAQEGGRLGFWTGSFGRGAHFSNLRYVARPAVPIAPASGADFAPGTIVDWELSEALDATALDPAVLPDLAALSWTRVSAQPWKSYQERPLGLVLISRHRRSPDVNPPDDVALTMSGRAPGAKVVFARAVIESDRDTLARLHFGYSDGVVIFAAGRPLFFGMNPTPFRDLGGVMESLGEAVYVPLRQGRNEIVLAVTEFFGGWGFWTRLDAPAGPAR